MSDDNPSARFLVERLRQCEWSNADPFVTLEAASMLNRYAAALARIRDAATVEQAREVARQAMEGSDE